MPPKTSPHFLGLQLSVDALRAAIVDEQLELIGSEHVDFDVEFPEYHYASDAYHRSAETSLNPRNKTVAFCQTRFTALDIRSATSQAISLAQRLTQYPNSYRTHGGVYASNGDVYMTSVEIWLRALDLIFDRLQRKYDLSKIKAISGAAQQCPVWLTEEFTTVVQSPSDQSTLRDQLLKGIASSHVPVVHDNSANRHAHTLENTLGGPESMANQVGVTAHASLLAAQILYLRDTKPEIWAKTTRISVASGFLCSILSGKIVGFYESEAAATGLYSLPKEQWEDKVLQIVAGSDGTGKLKASLGGVERNPALPVGRISTYFTAKYGLDGDVAVYPFTSEHLASYLSLAPSSADCVIEFGTTDILLTPSIKVVASPYFITVPHPAQDTVAEKRKYISMVTSRNADVPRALVRDAYTKSWSAFDRLVAVVPPGGSIGLDDKLFSFWLLQEEQYPFNQVKGAYRFETGVKVAEFRDLRANPRCLLESQILSLRVRLAHLNSHGVFLPSRTMKPMRSSQAVDSIGLRFDPYDTTNLPRRILATGSACTFPSVVGLLGDVFNAPVLIPNSLVEQSTAEVSKLPYTARPALGAAYVARWGWRKTSRPDEKHPSFEDELRWLMTKKSTVAGNGPATSGGNRSRSVSAPGTAPGPSSHKYLHAKSGLAASSFAEEDEEEESYESGFGQYSGTVTPPRNPKILPSTPGISSAGTTPSLGSISGSSANLTPNIDWASEGAGTPGGHPPLAPIQPLPTDDADVQLGLVKVAEADHDTFLTYAAIVPEFCRLERMIVKGLV